MYKRRTLKIIIFILQLSVIYCQLIFPKITCPDIFKYVYDGAKWSAEITLPTPDVNNVVLVANFSLPQNTVTDVGKLLLNNKDAIDDIRNKRPFNYTYILPKSKYIPQIIEITYNGDIVCVASKIRDPTHTTYWLNHTLNWVSSDIILPPRPANRTQNIFIDIPDPIQINIYPNDENCGMIKNRRRRQVNTFLQTDIVPLIYSGRVVARNDHPWLAALFHTDNGPLTFFCGGNLISNKHILSAAHCTLNVKNIEVKVGAHDTKDFFERGAITRKVEKVINHEEYRLGSGHADISVLILKDSVEFTEFVKPICIWNNAENINRLIGDQGTIMGWGSTENGELSTVPLRTDITIVSQKQCQSIEALKNSLSNATFCAGTKGAGPCMGDSGGGLLLKREDKWYIRGIISISVGSRRLKVCDVNSYAVYVDTVIYIDWIINNIK